MKFQWTDLIPSFIAAGTDDTAEQQLELLRQIYNQDFGGWLERWRPGWKDRLQ